ncbi:MAG: type II toxin-antitoxin system RelE/ParE family toxin [Stellaceae bacterium]
MQVLEYVRADVANPYRAWFDRLNSEAAAKVATAIMRLSLGNSSRVKRIGTIGEYRLDWGPGYRIYLGQDGPKVVILLGGGTKQRQQADIERAKTLWAEYESRKSKGKG